MHPVTRGVIDPTQYDVMDFGDSRRPTGVLAETFPREEGYQQNASLLTSGQLYLTAIRLRAGLTVTNIGFISGATPAGTPTNWWFALYDSTPAGPVLLRQTADQLAAAWAANTDMPLALTSPYQITSSGLYYIGPMVKATTPPTLAGRVDVASSSHGKAIKLAGTSSGALTTTAPNPAAAVSTFAANGVVLYGYVT